MRNNACAMNTSFENVRAGRPSMLENRARVHFAVSVAHRQQRGDLKGRPQAFHRRGTSCGEIATSTAAANEMR
jgi:hypothetical protein